MFKYFKRLFKKPVDTIELLPKLLSEGNSQILPLALSKLAELAGE